MKRKRNMWVLMQEILQRGNREKQSLPRKGEFGRRSSSLSMFSKQKMQIKKHSNRHPSSMAWLEQGIYKKSETPVMKAYRQQDMKATKLTDDTDNEAQVHVWHGRTLTDIPGDWWLCKPPQLVGNSKLTIPNFQTLWHHCYKKAGHKVKDGRVKPNQIHPHRILRTRGRAARHVL